MTVRRKEDGNRDTDLHHVNDQRDILESRAAELADKRLDWNELDFVGWKEFRRMAPAVVGLEINRLERLMSDTPPSSDDYNALVRARHALRRFADGIETAEKTGLEERADHLRRALLALSLLLEQSESKTLRYSVHRLRYVHDRLKLVY